jgi:type II secretory pathway pseudopilin PulG
MNNIIENIKTYHLRIIDLQKKIKNKQETIKQIRSYIKNAKTNLKDYLTSLKDEIKKFDKPTKSEFIKQKKLLLEEMKQLRNDFNNTYKKVIVDDIPKPQKITNIDNIIKKEPIQVKKLTIQKNKNL